MSESLPPDQAFTRHPTELSEELRKLGVRLGVEGLRPPLKDQENARAMGIESVVPGQVLDTPCGNCFVVETRYPLEHVHGASQLSMLPPEEHPSPLLAHLAHDDALAGLDFRSAIFFDIETTGLGIGSGMYAFMVGFGTFEDNEFCLRQYFMRDYHEEGALLHLLHEQMQGSASPGGQDSAWWVSFNGRNFDLPVLQTRFICGGYQDMPLARAPHLDLLYPARRLWRRRLASCALSSLESNVLGLTRESDVPGWMIPGLYFDYLRYGQAQPLRQVFVHNALDILSLVTLTAKVNHMLRDPFGEAVGHAVDRYSLGIIFDAWGQRQEAQQAFERALNERLPPDVLEDASRRLSFVYKSTGQIEQAVQIWEALREENKGYAYVELAKYYEHRQSDHLRAAKLVCEALALDGLPAKGQCSAQELQHRLARLKRKLGDSGLPMPHIESYSFGSITVDNKTYDKDLIILPGGVRPGWWRKKGHSLHSDDLQQVIEAGPSVLVIGTGNLGRMQVSQETIDYLAAHNIRAQVERTAVACERYNALARVEQAAAALHLTC
jgi:uncharacterized protein YprB with RNaseH-like and TPR domain